MIWLLRGDRPEKAFGGGADFDHVHAVLVAGEHEVDAALDDTNSRLFTSMLKRLAKKSQLLVITHNHETMLQADELFGITASPKTASTVIAVDLRQAEELVATS